MDKVKGLKGVCTWLCPPTEIRPGEGDTSAVEVCVCPQHAAPRHREVRGILSALCGRGRRERNAVLPVLQPAQVASSQWGLGEEEGGELPPKSTCVRVNRT